MRRSSAGIAALCAWAVALIATVWSADPDTLGRPDGFKQGIPAAYAVWYDEGQWHLRVTSRGKGKATFAGSVTVDGDTLTGEFQGLEKSRRPADSDRIVAHKNKKGFDFRFTTAGKVDGVSFTPGKKAKTVTFKLLLDGDEAVDRILIGKAGAHPDKAEFTCPAHPKSATAPPNADKPQ